MDGSALQNPQCSETGYTPRLLLPAALDSSLIRSLLGSLWATFFAKKPSPYFTGSRPVHVKEAWGEFNNYGKAATYSSTIVHVLRLTALIVSGPDS